MLCWSSNTTQPRGAGPQQAMVVFGVTIDVVKDDVEGSYTSFEVLLLVRPRSLQLSNLSPYRLV